MLDAVLALNGLDTRVFDAVDVVATPHEASDYITVPDAHLLFNGEFKRVGTNDLKIEGSDGKSFFIEDYFSTDKHKHLMSPEGALLTSNIVDALAGPLAPGQHAQAGAQPSATQVAIGRVETASGGCTVVRNGVSVVLNAGDNVQKGDVVVTSSASAIAIVFTDGSTFSLSANARMVLDDFVYAPGGANNIASISLVQGTFSFLAGQVAKTGNMKVDTPVATMGIRGTAIGGEVSAIDGTLRDARVMPEVGPNGEVIVGSFQLLDKITGQLLATVNSTSVSWIITPSGPQQVTVTQTPRSPDQIQQDANSVQQLVSFYNSYQANPIQQQQQQDQTPDKQNDTPGKQGSTGSGSGGGAGSGDPPPTTGQQTNTTITIKLVDTGTVPGIAGATGGVVGTTGGLGPTAGAAPSPGGGAPIPTATVTVINGSGIILGTPGEDLVFGSAGPDVITALAGNDEVYAGGGDDVIIAGEGAGNDFYDGGTGYDTIKFESANGVVFNLDIGTRIIKDEAGNSISVSVSTADGASTGHDEFVRIEKIVGSPGNDVFVINQPINWEIDGGAGVDIVRIAGALDLTAAAGGPFAYNIEVLDLNQNFANKIQLNAADVVTADPNGPLRILGGTTDVINFTSTYQVGGTGPEHIGTWQLVRTFVDPTADNSSGDPFNDHVTDGVTFDVYEFVSEGQVVATVYIQDGMQINVTPGQTNAVNDIAAMTENQSITVDVLANDAPGFDTARTLTALGSVSVTGPDGVSLGSPQVQIVNNQLSVVPGAAFDALGEGQTATITVPYTMQIGSGQTLNAVATITVTGTNDAPTTSAVTLAAIAEDSGARIITSAELLANASDVEHDALTVSNLQLVGNGALVDNGNGTWTYTPAANDDTAVSFNYTINDGGPTGVAGTATLDITPVNDAPTTSAVTLAAIAEDSGARVITAAELLVNAIDVDGDALTVTNLQLVGNGTLVENENGTWTYTPAANDDTSVSFTYTIIDSGSVNQTGVAGSATLDITPVNDAPTTSAVTLAAIAEDSGARIITSAELLANASDVENDSLTVSNLQLVGNGTLVENENGTWTYTPAANDDTSVSFNYTINDGGPTGVAGTATLDITPVNDAPYFSSLEGFNRTTTEDDSAVTFNLLNNAVDPDGDPLSVQNVATSAVNGQGGTVNVSGAVSIDDNNVTIDPKFFNSLAVDQSVTITVNYDVSDGHTTTHNIATLVVNGVNDAPHADDVELKVNVLGNGGFETAPDFTGWQVNTDTSGLSQVYYSNATIDRSGTIFAGDDAVAVLNFSGYVPEAGAAGSGPSITSDTFTGYAGSTIRFVYQLSAGTDSGSGDLGTVTGYIIDADTGEIVQQIYNSAPLGSSTGPQTVNVQLEQSGDFKIVFVVGSVDSTQGHVVGSELDLSFAGIIQNGISEDTTYTFAASNFLDTATDAEGDPLIIGTVTTSAMGAIVTLNADGTVTYDPTHAVQIQALAGGETATDTFTFTVTDSHGAVSNVATATVTVLGVDDAPVANLAPVVDTSPIVTQVSVPDELPAGANPDAVNAIAPAVSNDGRYVVFFSTLELPDNNDNNDSSLHGDVFLYDRLTGTTTTLTDSAHIAERPLGEFYVGFSITGDGRYVVFEGDREVSDNFGTHTEGQIYFYDRVTDQTHLLVNPVTQEPYSVDGTPRINSGGLVTFVTQPTFSENNEFTPQHILVTNLNGQVLASVARGDVGITDPNTWLEQPDLSGNGRYLTFWSVQHTDNQSGSSDPIGTATLYSYDTLTHSYTQIATTDAAADGGDQWWASMSDDGRYTVFQSSLSLVAGDTNDVSDIYLWDRAANDGQGGLVCITLPDGVSADGGSLRPSISADGRYITFASEATNLVSGDTNGQPDTFIYDRQTDTFERVSVAHDGTQGNGDSSFASDVSNSGKIVVFSGTSSNLVPGDNNDAADVFIVDRSGGTAGVAGEDASVTVGNTVGTHGAFAFSDANLTDTHLVQVTGVQVSGAPVGFTVPEGGLGTFTASVIENAGDADPNGQIAWTFDVDNALLQGLGAGQRFTQTYTIEIDDQHGGTVPQNVVVTITGRNDAPAIVTAAATGQVTADEDEASGSIAFSDVDLTDTHNVSSSFNAGSSGHLTPLGVLTATLVNDTSSGTGGLVSWHYDIDPAVLNGMAPGSTQNEVFNVKVDDGHGGTVTQLVTITLNGPEIPPENAAPVANAVAGIGDEDQYNPIAITLTGSDSDGSVTGFQLLSLPTDGWLYSDYSMLSPPIDSEHLADVISAYGGSATLYFKPDANWNGETDFQFVAIDNQSAQSADPATATITVNPVNDAPGANDIGVSTSADNFLIPVTLSGSDIDGTIAGFQLSSLPLHGTLYVDAEQLSAVNTEATYQADAEGHVTFYFVPNAEWPLETTFEFVTYDNLNAVSTSPGHVTITADPNNVATLSVQTDDGFSTASLLLPLLNSDVTEIDSNHIDLHHEGDGPGNNDDIVFHISAEGLVWTEDEPGEFDFSAGTVTGIEVYRINENGSHLVATLTGLNIPAEDISAAVQSYHDTGYPTEFAGLFQSYSYHAFGGGGPDILTGGIQADIIEGGGGSDILTGGAGNDHFVFHPGDGPGHDIITDMTLGDPLSNPNADIIDLEGFGYTDVSQLAHTDNGNGDMRILLDTTPGEEQWIDLTGVSSTTQLNNQNFHFGLLA